MFSYLDTESFEKFLKLVFFGVALLDEEVIKELVHKCKLEPLLPGPCTPDFGVQQIRTLAKGVIIVLRFPLWFPHALHMLENPLHKVVSE